MGLMNPAYAPPVPFERPTEDADGNATYTPLGSTPTVVQLIGASGTASGQATQSIFADVGTVFVPRGSNIKIGDRFTWGGAKFMLTSGPIGDQDQVFTGDDFGWVSYAFVGKPVRWGQA